MRITEFTVSNVTSILYLSVLKKGDRFYVKNNAPCSFPYKYDTYSGRKKVNDADGSNPEYVRSELVWACGINFKDMSFTPHSFFKVYEVLRQTLE